MTFDDSRSSAGRRATVSTPTVPTWVDLSDEGPHTGWPPRYPLLPVSCHPLSRITCYCQSTPGMKTTLLRRTVDTLGLQGSLAEKRGDCVRIRTPTSGMWPSEKTRAGSCAPNRVASPHRKQWALQSQAGKPNTDPGDPASQPNSWNFKAELQIAAATLTDL